MPYVDELTQYFAIEYPKLSHELQQVEEMLRGTLKFFNGYMEKMKGDSPCFAYSFETSGELPKHTTDKKYSYSTTSMILSTLIIANNSLDETFFSYGKDSEVQKKEFKKNIERLSFGLYRKIMEKEDVISISNTWGNNDPLTLLCIKNIYNNLWFLLNKTKRDGPYKQRNTIAQIIPIKKSFIDFINRFKSAIEIEKEKKWSIDTPEIIRNKERDVATRDEKKLKEEIREGSSVLIKLRRLRLVKDEKFERTMAFAYFNNILHWQLAYSEIPDERFDPAQLSFALEGTLIADNTGILPLETIEKVLDALQKAQSSSAFWRPVEPVFFQDTGFTLMPSSIEVANSLMRSWENLHSRNADSKLIPLFKGLLSRYTKWLVAQKITFNVGNITAHGWEAESIGRRDKIHLWQTGEILSFLVSWKSMLDSVIAQETLDASGLQAISFSRESVVDWESVVTKYEPLRMFPIKFQITRRIYKDFIKPRKTNVNVDNFSFLLYGPPGTGKSTLVKNIACCLNYKFITVTPGDFTIGGTDDLESRIKNIFRCLQLQKNAVVLFDEMDQFLLDRDSEDFRKQTSILQFLTHGMLTKIANLRAAQNCLFIIATNYAERIDPAIRRKGRLDFEWPLMPPDWGKRQKLISEYLKFDLPEESFKILIRKTALCSPKEIEAFLRENKETILHKYNEDLKKNLPNPARAINPKTYGLRFSQYQKDHTPEDMQIPPDLDTKSFPECLFNEMAFLAAISFQNDSNIPREEKMGKIFDLTPYGPEAFQKGYEEKFFS